MLTRRQKFWGAGFAVILTYAVAQSIHLISRVPGVPWIELFMYELPIWCSVVAVSPAIFFVARRLPLFGDKTFRNAALHLVPGLLILLAMFFLTEVIRQFVMTPLVTALGIATTKEAIEYRDVTVVFSIFARTRALFTSYILFFIFTYYGIVLMHEALVSHRQLIEAQLRAEQLDTLLARSELHALKLQIQPHFLFNTLNSVSALMTQDVVLARRTLARLSDLLRGSLRDSTGHEAPLAKDLDFLDAYIEIQQARFGSRLTVEKNVDARAMLAVIPRMLLQPLVENSIRHGMRDGQEALVVQIDITAKMKTLRITVSDNGRGSVQDEIDEGLGLTNIRERLELLYRDRHEMNVRALPSGGFGVSVSIPLRMADDNALQEAQSDVA